MWGEIISIKNLALLLAVFLMGFCLISSVSAMDVDDSDLLSVSDDMSGSSISSVSDEIGSGDSSVLNEISSTDSSGFDAGDSNINDIGSDTGSSNENSENEVLSTDNVIEDSDLEYDLDYKKSKVVFGSSALEASASEAGAKTKTSIV